MIEVSIADISTALTELIEYKNGKYGNILAEPLRIFDQDKAGEEEYKNILMHMDEKLSRIKNRDTLRINDISDYVGYTMRLLKAMSKNADVIAEIKKQMD